MDKGKILKWTIILLVIMIALYFLLPALHIAGMETHIGINIKGYDDYGEVSIICYNNANGENLENVNLTAYLTYPNQTKETYILTTDRDGRASIDGLGLGNYTVYVYYKGDWINKDAYNMETFEIKKYDPEEHKYDDVKGVDPTQMGKTYKTYWVYSY